MTAGMLPMALGWNEGGEQIAPLGRAVIGGLAAATLATLVVLPTVFAIVQAARGDTRRRSTPPTPKVPVTIQSCGPAFRMTMSPETGSPDGTSSPGDIRA